MASTLGQKDTYMPKRPTTWQRFKRTIYAVDSTTIQLVANCMDWAKHRRRKDKKKKIRG